MRQLAQVVRRILVVEDEPLVLSFLAQLLVKHELGVTEARSGQEAMAALHRETFDAVLCDFDLGAGLNGIDLMRSRPERARQTPFVILTAHGTIDRCRDAMLGGAANFLEKPISPVTLLTHLDIAISGRLATVPRDGEAVLPTTAGDVRVRLALKAIAARFRDAELSVADVAQAAGVSPEHLARLFRLHLGQSPLNHIHANRIDAAVTLLKNFSLSVYEVARESGYSNTTELDGWLRHFRQVTPSGWRERLRAGS